MFIPENTFNFRVAFKDKLNGHINVFYYLYAVMKYCLKKHNINDEKNNGIISLTFAIIFSPIIFITILFFRIYRLLIYALLSLAHGRKLHSLLDGTDAIFNIGETETSRSVILILLLVEHPGTGEELFKKAKEEVLRIFSKDKFRKMHVTRRSFMGYYYYKNGQGLNEDCIKTFLRDDEITSVELQKYVSQFSNGKFPHEDTGMWDVHIGVRRVTDKNAYPIIFRFHHCLGDGSTVFNIFGREFSGRSGDGDDSGEMVFRPRPVVAKSLKESFLKTMIIDEPDRNVLCDDKVSGNKELVWFSDDSSRYIDLVKGIKKKHRGATFVDVMLTAVSASLYSYARKKSPLLPKTINAIVTVMPTSNKSYKYGDVEHYKLRNKFTLGMTRLPLKTDVHDEDEDLMSRLRMVCEDYDVVKNKSLDTMYNRWQGRVLFTALPLQIMGPIYRRGQPTILFSNLPGCDHLDIFGGCPVKEFVVFDPNVAVSGISVMISTYENRLNIGFTFDKSIVPTAQDGEEICDNVLRTLDRLDRIL